nr:hypothetical protein [Tanacetum cinerariifolium]
MTINELIRNLKVYEMVLDNDGVASETTKEKVKPLALKDKVTREQTSDNSICQGESDEDKSRVKKVSDQGVNVNATNYDSKNHLAGNCPKPNYKAFVRETWSDSEDDDEPQNNATCLMAIDSQEKFGMENPKVAKTSMSRKRVLTLDKDSESIDSTKYRGMIGSLLYLTASRSDIMFSVCLCARLQENPKDTRVNGLVYANSDNVGDVVDRKRTCGICTFVGSCLTSCYPKKQTSLANSITESDYVAAKMAYQQALWMNQEFVDYNVTLNEVPILCDDKCAINITSSLIDYPLTKHIEIRHLMPMTKKQKREYYIAAIKSNLGWSSSGNDPSLNVEGTGFLVCTQDCEKFTDVVMRIGPQITIKFIFPNHFQVGTVDNKVVINIGLNNDRIRSRCYNLSIFPHRLIIRIEDYYFLER